MSNKDYRELQISSSQLVVIFMAIIILGIVIFLLGVSTGKKHALIAQNQAGQEPPIIESDVQAEQPVPIKDLEGGSEQPTSQSSSESPGRQNQTPPPSEQQQPSGEQQFYIQVGAFSTREAAATFSEQYRSYGLGIHIHDPMPTDTRKLYKVRLGGFATREQAEAAKTRLPSSKVSGSIIVRH